MSNRLSGTASPYLQQHARNPVHWQPWDDAALAQARRDNKPILLSVGYSACHWCHVMEHESFEDVDVARAMNEHFVNIKVDREERPDLDQVYQRAHALLTQQTGGWPLTLFLAPDGTPFFGGTYFPRHAAYGRPGFLELLGRVAQAWREQGDAIAGQNARLREWMQKLEPEAGAAPPASAIDAAWTRYAKSFDPVHGGFGGAPKFPHAPELELVLDRFAASGDAEARNVLQVTLANMAAGGIHDQLGGGFCRYSVDAEWSIPHFEKMLSDNAQLLGLYASFAARAADPALLAVAQGIVGWMTREMRAPDGAFWSSLDADSDGEEGKFYVWTADEVRALLDADEWAVAAPHYGLDRAPNFEGRAWNLRVVLPLIDVAMRLGVAPAVAAARLASARGKLFAARGARVRPGLDDKILTAWNALAIGGLARAARASRGAVDARSLAFTALDTLRATAWRDGRLRVSRQRGEAMLNAYLDDYAFLLAALVECMELDLRAQDLGWAREIADALIAHFEDREHGGFFFVSHDHEALILRHKPGQDTATPSGNGTAALALARLAVIAGEPRYAAAARRAVDAFGDTLTKAPDGFVTLLRADAALRTPPALVIIDGDPALTPAWSQAARAQDPQAIVIDIGGRSDVPAALCKGPRLARDACAYVCRDFTCLPRIDDRATLEAALTGT
ncbi:MAG TPA: thioredoxin domain-containing protein [Casimicrobiaceae bacterium]|nr:thioredoxin domain-containing protein [Casimicrobiaceae bacterium]